MAGPCRSPENRDAEFRALTAVAIKLLPWKLQLPAVVLDAIWRRMGGKAGAARLLDGADLCGGVRLRTAHPSRR